MKLAFARTRGVLEWVGVISLIAVILLPLADNIFARFFWSTVPQAADVTNHALFVVAFVSSALASLDRRHLSLSATESPQGGWKGAAAAFADAVTVTSLTAFFWASLALVPAGFSASSYIWFIPVWAFAMAMPVGFGFMAAFAIAGAGDRAGRRVIAAIGLAAGSLLAVSSIRNLAALALGSAPAFLDALSTAVQGGVDAALVPLIAIFVLAAFLGAPLFASLSGIALALFVSAGSYIELAPSEAYALIKGGSITAIPLFATAGFLLAETGAGKRLVGVLTELVGWFRGGEAIVAVLACAFFTTFTGANGVTILALGGILATALVDSGSYSEKRARGLVASSGAIGLLLPPSAAVIVYGINAQFIYGGGVGFDVVKLFKGALIPGGILIIAMCIAGVVMAKSRPNLRRPSPRAALRALKPAALELLVPVIAALMFFTGFASLTEIGAFCVLYIAIVEGAVKKELGLKGLLTVARKSLPVLGATLIILAAARGLSYYIIDANIPAVFAEWVSSKIESRFAFIMALNCLLLVVGCLMDIYSAILVIAPLLIPLAQTFGLDPVHFGIIFILNLAVGFLTPPVGMNLFLASFAFKKPLAVVVKDVLPFLAVQIAVLLLVSYLPILSTALK
ncbi:MAG: TRAP transporter large permease subunit [Spirochaetaceae bacterium]|nr:TRAP transporter large permease subunit [Spirochaetaceae bacterium]